jgi:gamma-glutamyltranspeptidase / glutathione hydrolase
VGDKRGCVVNERRRVTRRLGLPAIGAVIAVVAASVAFAGRGDVSPNPFGIPTKDNPNPSANITAVRGDRLWNWTEQTRSEVLARHGVVATSQPLAAEAGLQILQDGGNAADAAVATAAMLGVVEPHSAGIGGDMEAIYYSANDHRLYGLNAAGWAPASATPDFYHQQGLNHVPFYGVYSATVPGAVDGWTRFLRRFGNMSLADVLQPSIETARQGFGLTERIQGDWRSYGNYYVRRLRQDPESSKVFLRDGEAPPVYSIFRNPDLARAYHLLAKDGRDAFYRGPIGRAIVKRMNAGGAEWKMSDLRSFKSEWVDPITTNYKGYDVYQMPPQTQGFATLEMLNILQECASSVGYDLRALGPRSAEFWSILVQAKRLAYEDLLRYDGDPRFVDIPLKHLISKQYAASLCNQIHPTHAPPPLAPSGAGTASITAQERGDTVYLTTADRWGNMASFIYSIYDYFGSQISVPGYGFPMNDRGSFFNLRPKSPDVIAPYKRPFLTIIPGFVMKNGRPLLSFGNMGGDEQAQAQATEIVNMIDLGMNVQAAGDAARFHHSQDADRVDLESNLFDLVGPKLRAMGFDVDRVPGDDDLFGGYQAILFQRAPGLEAPPDGATAGDPPVNGVYRAGSDFRKDGEAVGW